MIKALAGQTWEHLMPQRAVRFLKGLVIHGRLLRIQPVKTESTSGVITLIQYDLGLHLCGRTMLFRPRLCKPAVIGTFREV